MFYKDPRNQHESNQNKYFFLYYLKENQDLASLEQGQNEKLETLHILSLLISKIFARNIEDT